MLTFASSASRRGASWLEDIFDAVRQLVCSDPNCGKSLRLGTYLSDSSATGNHQLVDVEAVNTPIPLLTLTFPILYSTKLKCCNDKFKLRYFKSQLDNLLFVVPGEGFSRLGLSYLDLRQAQCRGGARSSGMDRTDFGRKIPGPLRRCPSWRPNPLSTHQQIGTWFCPEDQLIWRPIQADGEHPEVRK